MLIFDVNGCIFKMVKVDGGIFDMKEIVKCGFLKLSSKEIVQNVTLSDYHIGEFPVTQALWQAVMGSNPSKFKGENLPVEQVSWQDCQMFISKLNSLTGNFRLPTEAEWEFACRGGIKSKGYEFSGSDNLNEVGWYEDNSGSTTHDVGTKLPNELGIYDMNGNVWEWCSDWYGQYTAGTQTNPVGPNTGSARIFRGGSWLFDENFCHTSSPFRGRDLPKRCGDYIGFRLALSIY